MRRRKTVLLALMLAAALSLGGCASQLEERPMSDISARSVAADVSAPQEDEISPQRCQTVLYFLGEDGRTLVPVVREIEVPGGVSRVRAALQALLSGPIEGEDAVWVDTGLPLVARSMELSGGVASVDLPARVRTLSQEMLYALRLAITATLTEFGEVKYVNVLIGGREEGFDLGATLPVGTLSRVNDLDVAARYDRLDEQRQAAQAFSQMTTLYLPDEAGRYLLCDVRRVDYAAMSPIEYLYTLLEEMGKKPGSALCCSQIPAPMDYIGEMPEIVRTEDGAYRAIQIEFDSELDDALENAGLSRGVYMAMLTYTLMGVVPGVEGLQVYIGDECLVRIDAENTPDGREIEFAQVLSTREDYAAYPGTPVTVYVPNTQQPDKLSPVTCIIAQAQQHQPRAALQALLAIEGGFADGSGLNGEDILAVSADGNRFAVNLSGAFADALRQMEPQAARGAVYAMVNTLTQNAGAGSVAFFFDGEQMREPLGELEMRGSFTRNPGMVVN